MIQDFFESSWKDKQGLRSCLKAHQCAFPHFLPPSFDTEMMANTTKSGSMSESQRSDQDTWTQMEVDSSEPFAIREIATEIDLVNIIKIKTNSITEIENKHLLDTETITRTNTTKVEEVVSLVEPALGHEFVAWDFAPPPQLFNKHSMTKEWRIW